MSFPARVLRAAPGLPLVVFAVCSLPLWSAPPVWAKGFGVYEQGTCVMGRAGATVAEALN